VFAFLSIRAACAVATFFLNFCASVVALIVAFLFVLFQSHVYFRFMCSYGTSLSSFSTAAAGHVSTIQILLTCLPLRPCLPLSGSNPAKPMSGAARAHELFVAASSSGITAEVRCARLMHYVSLSGFQRILLKLISLSGRRWSLVPSPLLRFSASTNCNEAPPHPRR
jgi:hypothetical protein